MSGVSEVSGVYNPRAGNPFAKGMQHPEWTSNNLILQDAQLRKRSGVNVLDSDITDMFSNQSGGSAKGAPFFIKNYGSDKATTYGQKGGASFPHGYFNKERLWS